MSRKTDMGHGILLINACVREDSRTLRLARRVLTHLKGDVTELNLEQEALCPLTREALVRREELLRRGELEAPVFRYARAFAAAEEIVLAAPYWDLSFPAAVKTFLEHVTVNGVTFSYGEDGQPMGHCKASRLIYVMTAGGPILPPNHGCSYVRDLSAMFYGIPETVLFSAELLDVMGADIEQILLRAEEGIDTFFETDKS